MSLVLGSSGGGSITFSEPNTASARTINIPDASGQLSLPTLMTAQTASGTAVDFTGIPSWVKRITVMFSGVSLADPVSNIMVQIGSGSISTSGYLGQCSSGGALGTNITSGFLVVSNQNATAANHGQVVLMNVSGNTWCEAGTVGSAAILGNNSSGVATLGGSLDRVRITTVNGTATFDAGTINVLYE